MARFDGFVLLAEMRTGSNFLEESLNLFDGLICHGEAFNPAFVGHHDQQELFGMDRAARDDDPLELMRRIFERSEGLGGFRLFHDHAPEVLEAVLSNPRVAKIHLTRNPLDAYISLKIANATGQWRLTDERHRKTAQVRFEAAEFDAILTAQSAREERIRRDLQVSGQTAFSLRFEQVGDVEILNGIARFLGLSSRIGTASARLKRQNPAPLSDKVSNFEEMQAALADMDLSELSHSEIVEPRHAAALGSFVASDEVPFLFMPVKGVPDSSVTDWLAQWGGLKRDFDRKSLRQWKNRNKDARAFTVVCHPVERAYSVFDQYILETGPGSFKRIRGALRSDFGLPIPQGAVDDTYSLSERRAAFLGFLDFLRKNLTGRTALRSDPAFASQTSLLRSMSEVLPPDMVIRADQTSLAIEQLCGQIGVASSRFPGVVIPGREILASLVDDKVETAVRAVYNRDFTTFGFRRWKA